MKFELQHNDTKSNARAGLITTDHGVIETPIFMPVGTQGTVKGVHMTELEEDINAQIILGTIGNRSHSLGIVGDHALIEAWSFRYFHRSGNRGIDRKSVV